MVVVVDCATIQSAEVFENHPDVPDDVVKCADEMWCNENAKRGVTMDELMSGIHVLMSMMNNHAISPFYLVWEENYEAIDVCMTTWLPREIMEDVVWLTGKGTILLNIPDTPLPVM